jgi:hypothetical protein
MPSRLTFTPGNHAYWLVDEGGKKARVPSVTTLLGQLAKPQLVDWAGRMAGDYANDHWADLAAMPPSQRHALISRAHHAARDKSAARGTHIHHLAEQLVAGAPVDVPADLVDTVTALARWLERQQFTHTATEVMVWSDHDDLDGSGYAGTADLIATHPRHGRVVLDWKTGKGVYPEHGVQVAAYADADHHVIDGDDTTAPPVDTLLVAHLRPDGVALHTLEPEQRATATGMFLMLRQLRNTPKPELKETHS